MKTENNLKKYIQIGAAILVILSAIITYLLTLAYKLSWICFVPRFCKWLELFFSRVGENYKVIQLLERNIEIPG